MRHSFGSMERLKAKARENLADGNERIRRWWCRKYDRPSTDPLFLERSYAEWSIEMIEDLLERREEIEQQIEDGTLSAASGHVVLRKIGKALGEEVESADRLIDQWERDIEEGRMPDLEAL